MDIDKGPIKASLPSSSKQKYSLNTGASSLPFRHATSVPTTSVASSEPANKKLNSLEGKGKQIMKSSLSAGYKIPSARAAKILNVNVLHSMQGTMNRVTDIFKKSISQTTNLHLAAQDEAL